MTKYLFFVAGVLIATGMNAQTDSPVVLVSAPNKVCYKSATQPKKLKLAPGAAVKKSGTIHLKSKSTALVYSNNRFQTLQGKGPHAMSAVFAEQSGLSSLNFDSEFGLYLEAAVQMANKVQGVDGWGGAIADKPRTGDGWGGVVADKPKTADGWGGAIADKPKTADGWGGAIADKPKTADGWGGKGHSITAILPFGKVQAGPVKFSWSKPAGAGAFQLTILDENKHIVHSATVQDTATTVDLRALNLTEGMLYSWNVTASGSANLVSDTRVFTLTTDAERARAIKKASNSKIYTTADPVLQGIMEAVALEKAEWYGDAAQTYAGLSQKHSGHNLLNMMHAAFWMRYGLEPKAQKAINP